MWRLKKIFMSLEITADVYFSKWQAGFKNELEHDHFWFWVPRGRMYRNASIGSAFFSQRQEFNP
jgi:hypothetical protein